MLSLKLVHLQTNLPSSQNGGANIILYKITMPMETAQSFVVDVPSFKRNVRYGQKPKAFLSQWKITQEKCLALPIHLEYW